MLRRRAGARRERRSSRPVSARRRSRCRRAARRGRSARQTRGDDVGVAGLRLAGALLRRTPGPRLGRLRRRRGPTSGGAPSGGAGTGRPRRVGARAGTEKGAGHQEGSRRRSTSLLRLLTPPQYVRRGLGLESAAVPRLSLQPDEQLHVLVPPPAMGDAVEALSPRVRAHLVDPADGGRPPVGRPRPGLGPPDGAPGVPDNGFLDTLPELRLVQLLTAGAETGSAGCPSGVALCNAPRRAHAVDRRVDRSPRCWRASAASRASSASQDAGRWATSDPPTSWSASGC